MTTTTTAPITLADVRKADQRTIGAPCPATLTPVDPGHGLPPVYLVSIDPSTACFYGRTVPAEVTIGGITRGSRGWTVVAYRDREAFMRGEGEAFYVPVEARNREQAVRMVLRYWKGAASPLGWGVAGLGAAEWRRV
ncbi:hypothetical protein AB0395_34900 [Streptosporangium sp. NPDC051023]|uniref:hypothetical protein n=1 Tax=Streptosporangium sp. NPDC051023 TaxID=3155410 RepID=UPI00344F1AC6